MPSDEAIDRTVLRELLAMFNGDKLFVAQVLETFIANSAQLITGLRAGAEQANPAEIHRAAHSLKSNSANVGALTLAQFCRELEELSRYSNPADAVERAGQIAVEFERVKAALEKFRIDAL